MKDKKKLIITMFCILSAILITVGLTVAIFTYTKTGDTENTITTGKLTFLYTENTGTGTGINITDAFPVSDELGKAYSSDSQVFDFKVESEIVGNAEIPYEVTVAKTASSTLDDEYVKIYLTDTTETEEVELLEPTLYSDLPTSSTSEDEKQIYFDTVAANEDYEKDFRLRMWIDENSNQEEINDKSFTVKVGVYSPAEKMEANLPKYTIVNDINSNKVADIGDEIVVNETDEHFYVISNDGTNINALAKYNLNVGNNALEATIGIQNENAIGWPSGGVATVAFSNSSSNYNESIVEEYVNDYVTYLNTNNSSLNAAGRLILKEEIESLVNDGEEISFQYINEIVDAKGYSWLYSTSYWTSSARGNQIWGVRTDGLFNYINYYIGNSMGVRPVITIAA